MMAATLNATDLETGDILRDNDGHEDRWDKIVVMQATGKSVLFAPTANGNPIKPKMTSEPTAEFQARIDNGRYESIDVECEKSLDMDALPVEASEELYIRFGDLPDGERSYDHTNNRQEDGVSVYEGRVRPTADDTPGVFVPVGQKLAQVLLLATRTTYLVTGDEVGRGQDGEPLLRNVETVCELTSPKGTRGFVPKDD